MISRTRTTPTTSCHAVCSFAPDILHESPRNSVTMRSTAQACNTRPGPGSADAAESTPTITAASEHRSTADIRIVLGIDIPIFLIIVLLAWLYVRFHNRRRRKISEAAHDGQASEQTSAAYDWEGKILGGPFELSATRGPFELSGNPRRFELPNSSRSELPAKSRAS